jgi:tetratricopeptide (TPR) repeat protein
MLRLKNIIIITATMYLVVNFSCRQSSKTKINPEAVKLCTEATRLSIFAKYPDSSKKALILLDKATEIDSNYYLGYFNKFLFLSNLKQFEKSVLAATNLIRLEPNAHDIYIIRGIFYEKIGDSISSTKDFTKSLNICNKVLDTMKTNNQDYELIMMNRGVNLILLNKNDEADIFLKRINDLQKEGELKNITQSMIGMNKFQLIDKYYSGKNRH